VRPRENCQHALVLSVCIKTTVRDAKTMSDARNARPLLSAKQSIQLRPVFFLNIFSGRLIQQPPCFSGVLLLHYSSSPSSNNGHERAMHVLRHFHKTRYPISCQEAKTNYARQMRVRDIHLLVITGLLISFTACRACPFVVIIKLGFT